VLAQPEMVQDGWTLQATMWDGTVYTGQDALNQTWGVYSYDEVPNMVPVYGNLPVMISLMMPPNNSTPQQPQQPKPPSVPWWMTFKLASHSDPPIQPDTCKNAAVLGVALGLSAGPWVEGPAAWTVYFGANALGIYGLANCS
jgi:hypothetical protein